jgi:hypothetical protein
MVGVAWAAIALLGATLLGSLYYLGARIDALAGRIDTLESSMNGRFDALSARINHLDTSLSARLDGLAARMDTLIERHAS